jgi:hypothetical protein
MDAIGAENSRKRPARIRYAKALRAGRRDRKERESRIGTVGEGTRNKYGRDALRRVPTEFERLTRLPRYRSMAYFAGTAFIPKSVSLAPTLQGQPFALTSPEQ